MQRLIHDFNNQTQNLFDIRTCGAIISNISTKNLRVQVQVLRILQTYSDDDLQRSRILIRFLFEDFDSFNPYGDDFLEERRMILFVMTVLRENVISEREVKKQKEEQIKQEIRRENEKNQCVCDICRQSKCSD